MKSRLLGCAAVVWGLLAAPAFAQNQAGQASDGAASAATSNVIMVTAQKREQDILDVPVAITALGVETLEAAQVNTFADITSVAPSLTVTMSGNNNQNTISMRGVGTFSFSTAVEPSVLVVVDDIALLQTGQAFANLSDPARIEVLRGPQGTLFGKSASAGVVSIVTQDPTDFLTGYVQASATNDKEYRVEGAISGPLSENAGFRLNAYYSDFEGYLNNLFTGNTLGAEEAWGLRGKFNFNFDNVDVTLIADYGKSNGNGGIDTYLQLDQVDAGGNPINQDIDLTGVTPGKRNVNVAINNENVNDVEQFLGAAKIDVDLGFATLSSITSYQVWDYYAENDQDYSIDPSIFQLSPYNARQVAQEIRLTSPNTGKFDYLLGLYFADGKTERAFTRLAPNIPPLRQNWESVAETTSYAAFAQLGYDISENTLVTVGARLNHEKIGVSFQDNRPATPLLFTGTDSQTAFTGKISLQHFFAESMMGFASVATGYKGQAYDISSGFNQRRADQPIASEGSVNYEVGIKGRVLNNLAQIQLVGFWTDYDNFQAQGINNELIVPQFELTNVGKLRTRGIEFDGSVTPTDNLTIFASAAYIQAKIKDFPNAGCYFGQTVAQGCVLDPGSGQFVQDLAGQDLTNAPDFKFNIGFAYDQPVSAGVELFLNGNYTWQDDINFALEQNPRTIQEAYGIANAAIGLQAADGQWRASIFVNNLFDKAYSARIIDDTSVRSDPFILQQQVPRNYSRYFGARVRFNF